MCPVHSPFGACLDPFLPLIPILCHREPALALTGQLSCLQPLTSAQALIQNTQKFQVQIWRQLYFTAYPDPNIYAQFWWKTVLEWKYTQGGKRISRVTAHPTPPPEELLQSRSNPRSNNIYDIYVNDIPYMTKGGNANNSEGTQTRKDNRKWQKKLILWPTH